MAKDVLQTNTLFTPASSGDRSSSSYVCKESEYETETYVRFAQGMSL